MWYSKEKDTLDYNKPIFAKHIKYEHIYILLPQLETTKPTSHNIVGYNWFNIQTGKYNSFNCFKSVSEAVFCYSENYGYEIYNGTLNAELQNFKKNIFTMWNI